MDHSRLDNLVRIGYLKQESADESEIAGLIQSGEVRLADAGNAELSLDSRFDLAYNAAHAVSLAALRRQGYRPENRYLVFQCLEATLGLPVEQWRVLDDAHRRRNNAEYEGIIEIEETLVEAMIRVTAEALKRLRDRSQ